MCTSTSKEGTSIRSSPLNCTQRFNDKMKEKKRKLHKSILLQEKNKNSRRRMNAYY